MDEELTNDEQMIEFLMEERGVSFEEAQRLWWLMDGIN
jgi:hypothetical protein